MERLFFCEIYEKIEGHMRNLKFLSRVFFYIRPFF